MIDASYWEDGRMKRLRFIGFLYVNLLVLALVGLMAIWFIGFWVVIKWLFCAVF